jgi:hypothetical protein
MRLLVVLPLALLVMTGSFSKQAPAATFVLSPEQDAYVHSWWELADTNFGDAEATVTAMDYGKWAARTYIMFDFSGIPASEQITGAMLHLYQYDGMGYGSSGVRVHHLANDTWDEGTITWNNRPDAGAYGDQIAYNSNDGYHIGWSSWDLLFTGVWDASGDAADGLLSLLLKETELGTHGHIFYTKEAADLRPYLTITTSPVIASPARHDFGIMSVGSVSVQQFTLDNVSDSNHQISALSVTGVNASEFDIQNDNCSGVILAPQATCTFDVVFEPDSLGSKEATVEIPFTDPVVDPLAVALTGLVTEVCECDLNHDGTCDMLDWLLFGEDWGRTNCNDPGVDPCECDLNGDGKCDMLDWLLFGEDWGRTDCPIP